MSRERNLYSAVALATLLVLAGSAHAADTPAPVDRESPVVMAVPAGPLGDSLIAVARAAGLTISIEPALVDGKRAPQLDGRYTANQAFDLLLGGSGLRLVRSGGNALRLVRGAAVDTSQAEGRLLSTVRVAGASAASGGAADYVGAGGTVRLPSESANGSSDRLATEGTGSYAPMGTTLAAGAAASIHDTPHSVSVVTRQRIEDQRLDNLNDVLAATPGIYTAPTSAVAANVVSRGFSINNYQIDGSAPLFAGQGNGNTYRPVFDMAEFDHVAVLRGGDALISGLGDPGGTINLQRKRPTATPQLLVDASLGSWDKRRVSIDGSAPFALNDQLRIRAVAARDQSKFFYERAYQKSDLLYVNLEYAPSASTGFNAGVSRRRQTALPGGTGLPRYDDGTQANLPMSTCYCFNDDLQVNNTLDTFLQFHHDWSPVWRLRANLDRSVFSNQFNLTGVSPLIGILRSGATPTNMYGSNGDSKSRQITGDLTLDGGFMLFGRQQTFTVGYTQSDDKALSQHGNYNSFDNAVGFYYDLVNFNPAGNVNYTASPAPAFVYGYTQQNSTFAQLRLNPIENLWLTVSARYGRYRYGYANEYWADTGESHGLQRPAYSARYDLSPNLNVYGSLTYIDTAAVNNILIDQQGKVLPPEKGDNAEFGLKYADSNGRLNATAAVFRTRRKGGAVYDFTANVPDGTFPSSLSCCWLGGRDIKNAGLELEVNGAITPHWQVAAGYTYTFTQKVTVPSATGPVSAPTQLRTPRNLFKLATSYAFTQPALARLTVGGDVLAQSGVISQDLIYDGVDDYGAFLAGRNGHTADFPTAGFVVFNVFGRYELTPKTTVQLNLRNLLDKRYYASNGAVSSGNRYGEPRSGQITLSTKF